MVRHHGHTIANHGQTWFGNEKPWYCGQPLVWAVIEFGLRMNLKRFILGPVSLINYLKYEPIKLDRQLRSLKKGARCVLNMQKYGIRHI